MIITILSISLLAIGLFLAIYFGKLYERTYWTDAYDYLNLYETSDGKLDLSVWTEVCGKEYYLSEYGKTWKEYEPTRKRKKTC